MELVISWQAAVIEACQSCKAKPQYTHTDSTERDHWVQSRSRDLQGATREWEPRNPSGKKRRFVGLLTLAVSPGTTVHASMAASHVVEGSEFLIARYNKLNTIPSNERPHDVKCFVESWQLLEEVVHAFPRPEVLLSLSAPLATAVAKHYGAHAFASSTSHQQLVQAREQSLGLPLHLGPLPPPPNPSHPLQHTLS